MLHSTIVEITKEMQRQAVTFRMHFGQRRQMKERVIELHVLLVTQKDEHCSRHCIAPPAPHPKVLP